jgi:uncharacterized protein
MSFTNKTVPHLNFFILLVSFYILNDIFFMFADNYKTWMAIDYATRFITLGLIFWTYKKDSDKVQYLYVEKLDFKEIAWVLALFLIPVFSFTQAFYAHFGEFNNVTKLFTYPAITNTYVEWFDLTIGLALVAFSEEIIFRVYFYRLFGSKLSNSMLILLSALLFGAIHWGTGLVNVFEATIWGAVGMAVFIKTRHIWPLIFAHFFYNFLSFSGVIDTSLFILF